MALNIASVQCEELPKNTYWLDVESTLGKLTRDLSFEIENEIAYQLLAEVRGRCYN